MTQKLLIVESPAKAKTIGKYLGSEYKVMASIGHIRDLPKSNKNAIDISAGFVPHYEISKGKEKVVHDLRLASKGASEVLLATDPDREGEAIAWHIAEAIGLKNSKSQAPNRKIKRVVFHEITKEAVSEALKHPRAIDDNLKTAQEARRVLDRLFGYDLSGLIWTKLRYGLSAGRVQSPALRILVEREKEIQNFVPEQFWVITAELETPRNEKIIFTSSVEPKTEAEAKKIVEIGEKASWQVGKIEASEMVRKSRAPFTTSTLQQSASTRLGLSPSQTMRLAQKLYEAGHITYMRTDSTNLNTVAASEMVAIAKKDYGENYASSVKAYATRSKNAQEAHEAIRPTHPNLRTAGALGAEQKLYQLIWRRTLASQMADAKVLKTKMTAIGIAVGKDSPSSEGEALPPFTANGYRITFDGWLKADPAARGEEVELPSKLAEGEPLKLVTINSEGKETSPPNRYSEAGLVKELEKRGIGRPSTYASIIKTIIDRGYVEKIQRSLKATDTGIVVSDFLSEHFASYISDSFTAKMEDELDEIATGKMEYVESLKNFYGPFHKAVLSKKKIPKISNLGDAPKEFPCPICGDAMIWKLGKNGRFMSCAKFPDCLGARTDSGEKMEGPKETGELCPDCAGKLVERSGRYGKFVSCGNYPKCKFIKRDANNLNNANDTNVKCPACNEGTMVEKRG
ncbi:MAG: type I DNA topoisomerase, partial [Patescibacteria group bacterium]